MPILSLLLVLALLLCWLYFRYLPGLIVVPVRKDGNLSPTDLGYAFEAVTVDSAEGFLLNGVLVPATVPARGCLIVLHGNGGRKESYYAGYLDELCRYGYHLLLPDLRAHGDSEGRYTTFGAREVDDLSRWLELLGERYPALPVSVFGHSMGGAIALQSLTTLPFRRGIVESAFAHLGDITEAYTHHRLGVTAPRWFSDGLLFSAARMAGFDPNAIDPEATARRVTIPTLIVHGTEDRRISVDHAHRLHRALAGPKALYLVEGAGHDDVAEVGGEGYWRSVRSFLA